jgi:hypothetical protein
VNKDRRKALSDLVDRIGLMSGMRDDIVSELEALKDEEQEYFDNMPESLQGGDKGQLAEQSISSMDDAINELDGMQFDDAISNIESACE